MKRADVYREAARSVETLHDYYSCIAIKNVCGWSGMSYGCPQVKAYLDLFAPHDPAGDYNSASYDMCDAKGLDRDVRVLALCFMAAIADASQGPQEEKT